MRVLWTLLAFGLGAGVALAADPLVAWVNKDTISVGQLQSAIPTSMEPAGRTLNAEERRAVLDGLIDQHLLVQEAQRRGFDQHPSVRKVMAELVLKEDVYNRIQTSQFTEEAQRAYYDAHRAEFVVPEKVQISMLTVRVREDEAQPAEERAQELYAEAVADPERFKELASTHSDDPYRRRGGDVGFVAREGKPGLDPQVVETAFNAPVGEVQPPLRVEGSYVIVLVTNRREAVERGFEQMQGSVVRAMRNEALTQAEDTYLDTLRAQAKIRVDEAALAAAPLKVPRPAPNSVIGGGREADEE